MAKRVFGILAIAGRTSTTAAPNQIKLWIEQACASSGCGGGVRDGCPTEHTQNNMVFFWVSACRPVRGILKDVADESKDVSKKNGADPVRIGKVIRVANFQHRI